MNIRFAKTEDSRALLDIYAQYIDTAITFEYGLPTEKEFAQRISSFGATYPYLVCEEEGRIIGYAYAHRQAERAAYGWNAELSVYLDQNAISRGIGTKLYHILMELLYLQGIKNVYGLVTSANPKSVHMHVALGFHQMAVQRNTGYKNGEWHDVIWFEKTLAPYEENPQPICSIHDVPKEQVEAVLQRYL